MVPPAIIFVKAIDIATLTQVKSIQFGPTVNFPNGKTSKATQAGHLALVHKASDAQLSPAATQVVILPGLTSASLISVGQLCDDGCEVRFNKDHATIIKNNKLLITAPRNLQDGLWDVILQNNSWYDLSTTSHHANTVISLKQTKEELLDYRHACLFSPVPSTLFTAIDKSNFLTFPGLDNKSFVKKHLTNSPFTAAGHLKQEQKNLRSTKTSNLASLHQRSTPCI